MSYIRNQVACLAVWNPWGMDEVPVDWAGVTRAWTCGVSYVNDSLLGVLEEWLLLAWRVIIEIGRGWVNACLEDHVEFHMLMLAWRINTFTKNELHNETAKWNTSSCYWLSRSLPYGLKDMGIDINGHYCNKIIKELSSFEIDESCVGQRIKIGKHDQLQSSQLKCKLGNTYGCAFTRDFMVKSKNL